MRLLVGALALLLLGGCGSVYLKHPLTSDVIECNGPGIVLVKVLVRDACRSFLEEHGYEVVEKCKDALPGQPCVTDAERDEAEQRMQRHG